ncbi:MAG TPA: anti-sigma factor [Pyrinomonadaceae bacterium]|jgi:anti-sigma-K factor RskA
MTHEEYKEMLAEHALGALDAGEARALESHLATCADCRAELAQWLDTSAALAYSAPRVEPPPALRSRLLESIRTTQAKSIDDATQRRSVAVEESASQTTPAATNVVKMPERARTRWSTMQQFGALAASLAFVAFSISLIMLWNRNRAMQAEMVRLNRDLQTTQEQLNREQEISKMFTAPDTRLATLTGTEMAPRAHARLAYNKSGAAMMIADELPPAPAGKDYQIWFIAEGKPVPGGVFKPDAKGHVEMHDQVPAHARGATAFAITLEPQGGTAAPTGEKYLLGAASS